MLKMPESPHWLISKGRHGDALDDHAGPQRTGLPRWPRSNSSPKRPRPRPAAGRPGDRLVRHGAAIVLAMATAHRHQPVMYYGSQLLVVAGFEQAQALIANIVPGVIAVIDQAICLFVLIDRVPRHAHHRRPHLSRRRRCLELIVIASMLIPGNRQGLRDPLLRRRVRLLHAARAQRAGVGSAFPVLPAADARLRRAVVLVLWVTNAIVAFSFNPRGDHRDHRPSFLVFFVAGLLFVFLL